MHLNSNLHIQKGLTFNSPSQCKHSNDKAVESCMLPPHFNHKSTCLCFHFWHIFPVLHLTTWYILGTLARNLRPWCILLLFRQVREAWLKQPCGSMSPGHTTQGDQYITSTVYSAQFKWTITITPSCNSLSIQITGAKIKTSFPCFLIKAKFPMFVM